MNRVSKHPVFLGQIKYEESFHIQVTVEDTILMRLIPVLETF